MSETQSLGARLKHAWNAFKNRDPTSDWNPTIGTSSSTQQHRTRRRGTTEKSIIAAVYTRIAIDVSEIQIQHIRQNDEGRYDETIKSGLNYIFNTEANIDQTSKAFIQDVVLSLFDEGCVAIVPIDTTINPAVSSSYEIQTVRTGKIVDWYPQHVKVEVYNDRTGRREQLTLPKSQVAIIENPLYPIMNEPNSTLKRLVHKLNLLDAVDEQSSSGKLDIIVQLPYVIKSEARKKQAELRRQDVETQLAGSKYGIAYIDGTERITQLNRASENNLMAQVQYLEQMLYSQLGLTEDVFNGKANEATMLNYTNRTIAPIVSAIIDEVQRKFLTKTARTQGQAIAVFRDAFKLVPVTDLADIADRFTRNEILSSNEIRATIGYRPSKDPEADKLRNKNINAAGGTAGQDPSQAISQNGITSDQALAMFEELVSGLEGDIDSIIGGGASNDS